jgi:predicted DNA-binding protein with PD1-like motif
MEYQKYDNTYVIRLDTGDEIMDSLKKFCRANQVRLGSISGIGTTNRARIGLLDTQTKEYHARLYTGDMEIIGLSGTVSEMNGETYLHIHTSMGLPDHTVVGGHLDFAEISAVAEIFIYPLGGMVDRKFSESAGVNLLQFILPKH